MLSFDGHFYETDVAIQLESGYSPYKGPVIFGTVSYEGTLLYFDPNFQPDSLKLGFPRASDSEGSTKMSFILDGQS